jgi:hypothetical protein
VTALLHRRTGFEIELLAPAGLSRRRLARELATRCGGQVRPVWHHDSEPSLVPGLGRFLHLTQGFEVRRADGDLLCTLVDDITLKRDLDPRIPPPAGWYRILTDDFRLLNLLGQQCDPGAELAEVLDPAAKLWGVEPHRHDDIYELADIAGQTIALAAPQGGERERPCEIVTPPLTRDHAGRLEELLAPARELGFTVPHEAAVHMHVDGAPFREPHALANVVRLFAHWREPLRALLGTNPACSRLAPLPGPLVAAAGGTPTFERLRAAATEGKLGKFFDVNLTQLFAAKPLRDTVEVRILPGGITTEDIMSRAGLVELLLDRCAEHEPVPMPPADPARAVQALMMEAAGVLARAGRV